MLGPAYIDFRMVIIALLVVVEDSILGNIIDAKGI